MEKYTFNDQYESVYEYSDAHKANIYIGSYYAYRIKKAMSYNKKVAQVEKRIIEDEEREGQEAYR